MIRKIPPTLLGAIAIFLVASPANAATGDPVAPAFAFTLDPTTIVQITLAVFLPILVGFVTTQVTSAANKSWLLAGLTMLTSLFAELSRALSQGSTYDLGTALLAAVPAFAISVSIHYGLWKPTGAAAAVGATGVTPTNRKGSSQPQDDHSDGL